MNVAELRRPLPPGLLASLEALHNSNPGAMERFFRAISTPEHTQSVTLHFVDHRLAYAEFRSTAK